MTTHTMTNRGLYYLANTAISGSTDIRCLAFKTTAPTVAAIRDYNTVADLLAATTEAAASGYSRKTLAGVTLTESDASDSVVLTATKPTWTAVAAGETWLGIAYYIEGASDAARTLLSVNIPTSGQVTNGGDITADVDPTWTTTGS